DWSSDVCSSDLFWITAGATVITIPDTRVQSRIGIRLQLFEHGKQAAKAVTNPLFFRVIGHGHFLIGEVLMTIRAVQKGFDQSRTIGCHLALLCFDSLDDTLHKTRRQRQTHED